jgi:Ca2+-transporting ATPase
MFNAKAFMTGRSSFSALGKCGGFIAIALVILIGQCVVVNFGGKMFNVEALAVKDWIIILVGTSFVLWIGEISRAMKIINKDKHVY